MSCSGSSFAPSTVIWSIATELLGCAPVWLSEKLISIAISIDLILNICATNYQMIGYFTIVFFCFYIHIDTDN